MNVRFLAQPQQELDEAVTWYDAQSDGLGREFLDELDRAMRRVVAYPASCEEIASPLRRCLFARFPYGLIYGIDEDDIVIVAVAHLHREPRYWIGRT